MISQENSMSCSMKISGETEKGAILTHILNARLIAISPIFIAIL